ncbi:MAG: TetR/AcrR family transcriptional regulator [Polyangiaceae bacterium]
MSKTKPRPRPSPRVKAKPKPKAAQPSRRRVPTQARSKERLERILDAADNLFAETGYDAATMELIAERAGTSIGSLYQFFPNKRAVFTALSQLYLERAERLFESLLSDPALVHQSWEGLLGDIIDAFWRFHVASPGFRAVWVHSNISHEMLVASDDTNRALASRAEHVIAAFAPEVSSATRARVAALLVETVSAILFVAVRREEPDASALVAELKRMVVAYLRDVIEPRGGERTR